MTAEDVVADARKSLDKAYLEVDMRTKRVLKRVLTSFRKHQVGA
jgi:cystathionine beta-lyase family protein involved in aluminum resistance